MNKETAKEPSDLSLIEQLTIAAIGFLLAAFIAGAAFFAYVRLQPAPTVQVDTGPQQYYRGIFDFCMAQVGLEDKCMDFISWVVDTDWYGQDSPGWDWEAVTP